MKGPLFLMVALSLAGACLLSGAVVHGEPSWVHALLPKRERDGLSQGWQETDRLLFSLCMDTWVQPRERLGSAGIQVECFSPQTSRAWDELPRVQRS